MTGTHHTDSQKALFLLVTVKQNTVSRQDSMNTFVPLILPTLCPLSN